MKSLFWFVLASCTLSLAAQAAEKPDCLKEAHSLGQSWGYQLTLRTNDVQLDPTSIPAAYAEAADLRKDLQCQDAESMLDFWNQFELGLNRGKQLARKSINEWVLIRTQEINDFRCPGKTATLLTYTKDFNQNGELEQTEKIDFDRMIKILICGKEVSSYINELPGEKCQLGGMITRKTVNGDQVSVEIECKTALKTFKESLGDMHR